MADLERKRGKLEPVNSRQKSWNVSSPSFRILPNTRSRLGSSIDNETSSTARIVRSWQTASTVNFVKISNVSRRFVLIVVFVIIGVFGFAVNIQRRPVGVVAPSVCPRRRVDRSYWLVIVVAIQYHLKAPHHSATKSALFSLHSDVMCCCCLQRRQRKGVVDLSHFRHISSIRLSYPQ